MGGDVNSRDPMPLYDPGEGTVARYLATPVPRPALERMGAAAFGFSALAVGLWALACWASQEGAIPEFAGSGYIKILLGWFADKALAPLALALVASLLAVFLSRWFYRGRADDCQTVKRAVLSAMIQQDRMGVALTSRLSAVGLKARHLGRDAVVCRCARLRFEDQDFSGIKSSDFGAVYHEVFKGRLYVYFTQEASDRIRSRRYEKAGDRHAGNR